MIPLFARLFCLIVMVAALDSCGGGGGGSSSSAPLTTAPAPTLASDGLGTNGLLPGTTELAGDNEFVQVVLGTNGVALAVVSDGNVPGAPSHSLVSSPAGVWGSLTSLPAGIALPPKLVGNAGGSAALLWTNFPSGTSYSLYYAPATGWTTTPLNMNLTAPNGGDFAEVESHGALLMDDNSLFYTFPGVLFDARLPTGSVQQLSVANADSSALGASSDGTGVMMNTSVNGSLHDLTFTTVFAAPFAALGTVPVISGLQLCGPAHPSLLTVDYVDAAHGVGQYSAFATIDNDPLSTSSCQYNALMAGRVNTFGAISFARDRVNSPNTVINSTPQLVMDDLGDALMVWSESTSSAVGSPSAIMWSMSRQGGAWSTAAPVLINGAQVGTTDNTLQFSTAINASGHAVVALTTKSVNPVDGYVCVARLTAGDAAFSSCVPAGNLSGISSPSIAINAAGTVQLGFSGAAVTRNGTTIVSRAPGNSAAYSVRL